MHRSLALVISSLLGIACFVASDDSDTTLGNEGVEGTESSGATSTETGSCTAAGCACTGMSDCDPGLDCIAGTCQSASTETSDPSGGLGACAEGDPWCPEFCPESTLVHGDFPDYGWCVHQCEAASNDVSACPAAPEGTQLGCTPVDVVGGACMVVCPIGSEVCPSGSKCIEVEPNVGLCMYLL